MYNKPRVWSTGWRYSSFQFRTVPQSSFWTFSYHKSWCPEQMIVQGMLAECFIVLLQVYEVNNLEDIFFRILLCYSVIFTKKPKGTVDFKKLIKTLRDWMASDNVDCRPYFISLQNLNWIYAHDYKIVKQ